MRTDIVRVMETNYYTIEAEYSNLTSNFVAIAEHRDSKLQAAMENIIAKLLQEDDKLAEKLNKNYIMKLRSCLVIFALCEMTMRINFMKSAIL